MVSRLKTLFGIFFYISAVTLGGGLAMLPLMREEFVEKRGWLSDDEMVGTVAAIQSMPGIIACNMGVLLGYRVAGMAGALVSLVGSIIPPFLAIVILAHIVTRVRGHEVTDHIFLGVRAAVSALILCAVFNLGKKMFETEESRLRIFTWAVAGVSFVALAFLGANAVYVLAAGALLGWLCFIRSFAPRIGGVK